MSKRRKSSCICINLRRAAQALTAYYNGILEPRGISITQFSILRNILRLGSCGVSELAGHLGLERSTLTRNLNVLLAVGYLEDTANSSARKRNLQVTPAGEQAVEESFPLWEKAQEAVNAAIGADQVRVLTELLSVLEDL